MIGCFTKLLTHFKSKMEVLLENIYLKNIEEIDSKIESTLAEVAKFFKGLGDEKSAAPDRVVKGEEDISAFLKIIIEFFQEHVNGGFEELLIPHLSEMRLQNMFPLLDDQHTNESEDSDEGSAVNLWYKLIKIVQTYIEEKLISTDVSPVIAKSNGRRIIWLRYLQILKGILAPTKLWDLHMKKRFEYLQHISCPCFKEVPEDLICLQCLFATCYELFIEDSEFIGLGCFSNLVLTWSDIYMFYQNVLSTAALASIKRIDLTAEKLDGSNPRYFKCFSNKFRCHQTFINYKVNRTFPLNLKRTNPILDNNSTEVIVIGLVELIHTFEKKVIQLVCTETTNIRRQSKILIQLPNDSPEQSPVHKNSVNSECPWLWDWRSVVASEGLLTYLQRNLQNNISNCVATACTKEILQLEKSEPLATEYVQCSQTRQKYRVFQSVSNVIKELNVFIPILFSSQNSLAPFSASFSHVLHTYLVELISHLKGLKEKHNSFEDKMDRLFTLHTSYLVLKESLQQYTSILAAKKSSQLKSVVASLSKSLLVEIKSIELEITVWYKKVLISGILYDSESHNWSENKPFLESENISYSLRMWNLFVKSMIHDMTTKMVSTTAINICFEVLNESLQLLVTRYAKAEPSEVGTVQIRTEITFILLCTMEVMPIFSDSYEEFLGSEKCSQIDNLSCSYFHSYCSSLVIILAIKTSPISALYKIFRMGFPFIQEGQQLSKFVAPWLPWLHPALLPHAKDGSIISSISVWLAVKFCTSKCVIIPTALIQALTMHTCTLAILLATEATRLPTYMKEKQIDLLYALLLIASHCRHRPTYMADILTPVIQHSEGWESFDGHVVISKYVNKDIWWFQALACFLKPTLQNILCTVICPVLGRAPVLASLYFVEWKTTYLHLRKVVRCSCSNASSVEKNVMLSVCSLEILQEIANSIATLPLPIQMCLYNLQNNLTQSNRKIRPVGGCLALQVITDIIYNILKRPSELKETFGLALSEPMLKLCSEVADYFLGLVTPKVKFEQCEISPACQEKAQGLLLQIHSFFKECNPKKVSERLVDDELYIPLIFSQFEEHERGHELLQYLYRVICVNIKWIQRSLGITYALSLESMVNSLSPPSPLPNFLLESETQEPKDSENLWVGEDNNTITATTSTPEEIPNEPILSSINFTLDFPDDAIRTDFNPLVEVLKIGDDAYTYKQLADFKYFWEPMLSYLPLLGLSEEGLKTLMLHRWDINNEQLLSETDAKYVEALKSIFGLEKNVAQ